ncbi:MAG: hypothetical protein JWO97_2731 [Acidobacteria bacterium]|nr:hypothetical protein [Acidobacteriota bacterium]
MMKRSLLIVLLFAIVPAVHAHWAVLPANINVAVGETMKAYPVWDHGLVMYEDRDDFRSDNPAVAYAYGFVVKLGQTGGSNGITVTGITAGVAHIINATNHETLATITVYEPPVLEAIAAPAAKLVLQLGQTIDLRAQPVGWEASTCTWYRGRIGDTSLPMPPSGTNTLGFRFYAREPGKTELWAHLASPSGSATVQFEIEVLPPRRRAAGH